VAIIKEKSEMEQKNSELKKKNISLNRDVDTVSTENEKLKKWNAFLVGVIIFIVYLFMFSVLFSDAFFSMGKYQIIRYLSAVVVSTPIPFYKLGIPMSQIIQFEGSFILGIITNL